MSECKCLQCVVRGARWDGDKEPRPCEVALVAGEVANELDGALREVAGGGVPARLRGGHGRRVVSAAKKGRYLVTGRFSVEVRATDEGEAQDAAEDMADDLSLYGINVECLTLPAPPPPPGPYAMPLGVGEWGPHIEAMRLADGERRHVGEWDGAWWWGNGHMLLRCPGPCVPENGGDTHDVGALSGVASKKSPAVWADGVGDDAMAYRCGNVGISRVYRNLVEAGAPGCSWWVGHRHDPILAKDAMGRIVAIVMPMTVTPEAP